MKSLNKDWFIENLVDFEYKKYVLMAYLQNVHKSFNEHKLYPQLGDLVSHYRNLLEFNRNRELLYNQFPEEAVDFDFEKFKVTYKKVINDDNLMDELSQIVDFSLPRIKHGLSIGKELFETIEDKIEIMPIGIMPLYKLEGYLLLKIGNTSTTDAYQYRITLFEDAYDNYRGIRTEYVTTYTHGITSTFEYMKSDLIKNIKDMPNPATYLVLTPAEYPQQEAILPITKRKFIREFEK